LTKLAYALESKETTVNADYDWTKWYEAAVLETNPNKMTDRIEDAKLAIANRVVKSAIDRDERCAVVKALNALSVLRRERSLSKNPLCYQCKDTHDLVTPMNGKTFLVKTGARESAISLHTRCVTNWAEINSFQALVPEKN
jgi:hypothetical protein